MLGDIVVYLCFAIILGVVAAWLLTSRSESDSRRDEAAKERPPRQG